MQKRYLTNWSYNAARIFDNLEKIVHDNGGILVSEWKRTQPREKYLIQNRTLSAAIHEKREFVEKLERLERPAGRTEREELERMEAIDNTPRETFYGDYQYIAFTLDGVYFYYQVDRNPFFPFYYTKSNADGGRVDRNTYLDDDKKEWLYDCFFTWNCSDADCLEAANLIFNMLMNAPFSHKARGKARPVELHALPMEV